MSELLRPVPSSAPPALPRRADAGKDALQKAAVDLEAGFLAEMLKSAGIARMGTGFDGQGPESEFATFLTRAYANEIARSGGVGLAEAFYSSLRERADD